MFTELETFPYAESIGIEFEMFPEFDMFPEFEMFPVMLRMMFPEFEMLPELSECSDGGITDTSRSHSGPEPPSTTASMLGPLGSQCNFLSFPKILHIACTLTNQNINIFPL